MKRFLFGSILALALVQVVSSQPTAGFTNNAPFEDLGPQIDSIVFVNNALFEPIVGGPPAFDFTDCSFYTNKSTMICSEGFRFDLVTNIDGNTVRQMAASFNNGNTGQIFAGGLLTSAQFVGIGAAVSLPEVIVNASNVINTGVIDTDVTGIMNISGKSVNLARGTLHVEGFDTGTSLTDPLGIGTNNTSAIGVFDQLSGLGLQSNVLSQFNFQLPSPNSPSSKATNILGTAETFQFLLTNASAFAFTNMPDQSNLIIQVVLINTNLPGIATDVRFAPGVNTIGQTFINGASVPTIEWTAVVTNGVGQALSTNTLFLEDTFLSHPTNTMVTNNFTFSGAAELAPYNYTFTRSLPGFNSFAPANFVPYSIDLFANAFPATNAYATYQVTLQPVAFAPDPTTPSAPLTNLPGRLLISAVGPGSTLDLRNASVNGPNYMSISATNHFIGASGASIVSPNMDLNLGTTNGTLNLLGVVSSSVARFDGTIDMWSGRWTNVVTNIVVGISTNVVTNFFHVLIVNSGLTPEAPVVVQNLNLRSTNVFIDDIVSVTNSMFIDAENLTINTNGLSSANPTGELLILNISNLFWPPSAPTLQNFTNWGSLFSSLDLDFIDQSGAAYKTWVNHGGVIGGGVRISADRIENIGVGVVSLLFGGEDVLESTNATIISEGGDVTLDASNAVLAAGIISTPADLNVSAGNLTISNHVLEVGGTLNFTLTNTLDDGGPASGNSWAPGNGINLFLRPAVGDFLGSTVTLTAGPHQEVDNTWDGQDLGPVAAGFVNNGALGHLILVGGDSVSSFLFQGLDSVNPYALYVDEIDLSGGATNRQVIDGAEAFTTFDLAPNFNIYFADAQINGSDISEKLNGSFGLNGAEGGQLIWVPSFAGFFSGTNLVAPSGLTFRFNRALKLSKDIDSNGSTPNFITQFPFNVNLVLVRSNNPAMNTLSWYAPAGSTNNLYVTTNNNTAAAKWISVTNFVQGPGASEVTVKDAGRTNGTTFYKVLINQAQP